MILKRLKDRLCPPEPITIFTKDRTSDDLKNQIISIMYRYFKNTYCMMNINYETEKSLETAYDNWVVSKCIPYYNVTGCYADFTISKLKELNNYEFFEYFDFVIHFMYSSPLLSNYPPFLELIIDLDSSLKLHGVDYTIIDGHLCPRTEDILTEKTIIPCMMCLRAKEYSDVDKYLKNSFQAFKDGKNNEAILYANDALENAVKVICSSYGIVVDDSKTAENVSKLLKETDYRISKHSEYKFSQMDKIFQIVKSIRNDCVHGSSPYSADDNLTEYMINLVCTDILFLSRTFPIGKNRKK